MRPNHFETPHSYLQRLCRVNVIDRRLIDAAVQRRAVVTGRRHQLAAVIGELGRPHASHFAHSYLAAPQDPADSEALLTEAYGKRATNIRHVCTRCTAEQPVETFDHWQFTICLRHGRWLAPGYPLQLQVQLPAGGQPVTA